MTQIWGKQSFGNYVSVHLQQTGKTNAKDTQKQLKVSDTEDGTVRRDLTVDIWVKRPTTRGKTEGSRGKFEKEKRKKKGTCHFSLEWKKIPAETKVSEPSPPPPGGGRQEGWGGKKERKKKRVKPQGSEVAQYFIHRASPE